MAKMPSAREAMRDVVNQVFSLAGMDLISPRQFKYLHRRPFPRRLSDAEVLGCAIDGRDTDNGLIHEIASEDVSAVPFCLAVGTGFAISAYQVGSKR